VPAGTAPRPGARQLAQGGGASATVSSGGAWMAVRTRGERTDDLRADFGLVAAKRLRRDGSWLDLVHARPRTADVAPDSAGPKLRRGSAVGLPYGAKANISGRALTVDGGWLTPDGRLLARGRFTYELTATGVRLTVARLQPRDLVEVSDFAVAPMVGVGTVRDGARTVRLSRPASSRVVGGYASGMHRALQRVVFTSAPAASRCR